MPCLSLLISADLGVLVKFDIFGGLSAESHRHDIMVGGQNVTRTHKWTHRVTLLAGFFVVRKKPALQPEVPGMCARTLRKVERHLDLSGHLPLKTLVKSGFLRPCVHAAWILLGVIFLSLALKL